MTLTPARPEYLSISDYARIYAVDRVTVHKWLKAGYLEHYRMPPKTVRIRHLPPDQHAHAASPAAPPVDNSGN